MHLAGSGLTLSLSRWRHLVGCGSCRSSSSSTCPRRMRPLASGRPSKPSVTENELEGVSIFDVRRSRRTNGLVNLILGQESPSHS